MENELKINESDKYDEFKILSFNRENLYNRDETIINQIRFKRN